MKASYILLAVALAATFPCGAQEPSPRLIPEAPEGHHTMGREYITLSNDSIDVELGYDGSRGKHMVFDLVVINRTQDTLSIDPSDFYFVLLPGPDADSSLLPPKMALHPERVLHRYEEMLDGLEEDREINEILGFIDAGIGLLADATAFLTTDDPGYIADAIYETVSAAGYYVSRDLWIGADEEMIRKEKEVVQEEILRQGELPPGNVVSGYVYFPRDPDAGYLMFCFPLDNQLFQFVYRQEATGRGS